MGFAFKDFLGIVLALLVGGVLMYSVIQLSSHYTTSSSPGVSSGFRDLFGTLVG